MAVRSIFGANLFANKVAIVTGGGSGIGAAIAHELCYLGCNVMIASRKIKRLKAAEEKMNNNERLAGKVASTQCNIRKEQEVKNLMEATVDKYGRIDFLVNNGGGQFIGPVKDMSEKGWHAVVETNLTGTFYCCKQAFLAWMMDNGGAIVNITANIRKGVPYASHTAAARAGVENLTQTLSLEWVSHRIRVNAVAPGLIYSPTAAANYPDSVPMFNLSKQPSGRFGRTEEIASAVCFLLSPAASYITGTLLKVDGAESLYESSFDIPRCNEFPAWSWDTDSVTSK